MWNDYRPKRKPATNLLGMLAPPPRPPLPPSALLPSVQQGLAGNGATNNVGADLRPGAVSPYPTQYPNSSGTLTGGVSKKEIQKRLMQQEYNLRQSITNPLYSQLNTLIGRAQQDRFSPEGRSAYLAPRLDQLDQGYQQAQGAMDRNLSARGLDSSSAAVSQFANLGGQYAQGRAGIVNGLYDQEQQRQQLAQGQVRDLLMSLLGHSTNQAGNLSGQMIQQAMQQAQMDQQNQFGLGDLLGGIGGLAGLAGGLGWNPFKKLAQF